MTAPVIVHCGHHRCGSTWFAKVLRGTAEAVGRRYVRWRRDEAPDTVEPGDVVMFPHTDAFDRPRFGELRGSHLVRDPRDVVVSAYFFHLWTNERWAKRPSARYGGRSYQEHLNDLDQEAGLAAEIERMSRQGFGEMRQWDYDQPDFLELRYEEVVADETAQFSRVFEHYGLRPRQISRALRVVERNSFSRVTGRSIGETAEQSHLRSGRPGEWQEVLTPAHRQLFRELNGDLLVRLGYETGDDW